MKTGSLLRGWRSLRTASAAAWPLLLLLVIAAPEAVAWKKKNKKTGGPEAAAMASVLAGTVFRDAGFALRGAEIVVTLATSGEGVDSAPSGKPAKPGAWRATSDARGEFLLRLPAGPGRYTVVVRAVGCKPQEKSVAFTSDGERIDQNFLLESAGGSAK